MNPGAGQAAHHFLRDGMNNLIRKHSYVSKGKKKEKNIDKNFFLQSHWVLNKNISREKNINSNFKDNYYT